MKLNVQILLEVENHVFVKMHVSIEVVQMLLILQIMINVQHICQLVGSMDSYA